MTSAESNNIRELYKELILDHARNPRNFARLPDATHTADGINPLCGDKLRLYFRIGEDNVIESATFEGSGCAISPASASMLTELVCGMPTNLALDYFRILRQRLGIEVTDDEADNFDLGKLRAFEGVREYPSRIKCATLAWHALQSAINRDSTPATSE